MAFPNLSEIVTTTLRSRTGELADNMSRNNALLARLSRRGKIKTFSGGRTIVQELNYANNQTFQWYSGYQTLNIAPSQIGTIGDMPNDVMMFFKSGLSIAMGNASDAVKAQANHVTASNEDEGFASAVRRYVLPTPSRGPRPAAAETAV